LRRDSLWLEPVDATRALHRRDQGQIRFIGRFRKTPEGVVLHAYPGRTIRGAIGEAYDAFRLGTGEGDARIWGTSPYEALAKRLGWWD
jgi:hypothetical protein